MYKKIYFMGIKGVGMATLAIIARQAGFLVAGSDVEEKFITDKVLEDAKIEILKGFHEKNVESFVSGLNPAEVLFIATGAHGGFDNPEASYARSKGIRVMSHGEAVGYFMSGELFGRKPDGISVAGAHGKTTIAAMVAFCLVKLGQDPSFTIGTSEIMGLGAAGHLGLGKYFVAEADEYVSEAKYDPTTKFLHQKPQYLIINNIDFDHPDFYKDVDDIVAAFQEFIDGLAGSSTLIMNGDDVNIQRLKTHSPGLKKITYGTGSGNDFKIERFKQAGLVSAFEVKRGEMLIGEFELSVPGYHNAKNSLAVIALLVELGFSVLDIRRVLAGFKGTKRRFERVGETSLGVEVFDDYAHHPEEIRKTLEAARLAYPGKKIIVIFQAHTFERTHALLSEFASSFSGVHEVIILPTFSSMRDVGHKNLDDDRSFVEKIRLTQPNVKLIEKASSVVEYLVKNVKDAGYIVLTLGAGDVYKIGYELVDQKP